MRGEKAHVSEAPPRRNCALAAGMVSKEIRRSVRIQQSLLRSASLVSRFALGLPLFAQRCFTFGDFSTLPAHLGLSAREESISDVGQFLTFSRIRILTRKLSLRAEDLLLTRCFFGFGLQTLALDDLNLATERLQPPLMHVDTQLCDFETELTNLICERRYGFCQWIVPHGRRLLSPCPARDHERHHGGYYRPGPEPCAQQHAG